MRNVRSVIRLAAMLGVFALPLLAHFSSPSLAQQADPTNLNGGRTCYTVRTCNFTRTGDVRGCLSSYSCRACRLVPAKCAIGAAAGKCQRLTCDWGG